MRKRARGFRSVLLLAALYTAAASGRAGAQGWFLENPRPASDDLYAVKFADAQSGWAVGEFGEIWHTTDGGTNWEFQTFPSCVGDCNGDGIVSVDEILTGVSIALGNLP